MDIYNKLHNELVDICKDIYDYYDIDKIKLHSVYIWTKEAKEDEWGENVFDIHSDKLIFYKEHEVIEDAKPIIEKIQQKLKEIDKIEKV